MQDIFTDRKKLFVSHSNHVQMGTQQVLEELILKERDVLFPLPSLPLINKSVTKKKKDFAARDREPSITRVTVTFVGDVYRKRICCVCGGG